MAAKGSIAKSQVMAKIAEAFGSDFIGEFDKKGYVWAKENGEKMQIAIALTYKKDPIQVDTSISAQTGNYDFSDDAIVDNTVAVMNAAPAEITEEETDNIAQLMAKLGL